MRAVPHVAMAVVLGLSATAGCGRRPTPEAGTISGTVVNVTVQAARSETIRDTLTAAGTIVPDAATDWTIYAIEPARIAELPKHEGDTVVVGDLLVRFDVPSVTQELSQRQSEFTEATSRATNAQTEQTRIAGLVERGVLPRAKLDEADHEVTAATTALTHAKALLNIAVDATTRTSIKAKFAGVVVKRWHAEGDAVSAGISDPVLRVVDQSSVQSVVPLTLAQLGWISPGQAAVIIVQGAEVGVPGVVAMRPVVSDAKVTTVDLRVSFVTPLAVPIDTPTQVEIVLGEHRDAIVVPAASVVRSDGPTYVMIATADGRAQRREVRAGIVSRGLVEILSGVAAGDLIIVKGLDQVTDGAAIAIER